MANICSNEDAFISAVFEVVCLFAYYIMRECVPI